MGTNESAHWILILECLIGAILKSANDGEDGEDGKIKRNLVLYYLVPQLRTRGAGGEMSTKNWIWRTCICNACTADNFGGKEETITGFDRVNTRSSNCTCLYSVLIIS
ncbi:hypothetical protein BHYA_0127g00240 [Botrytis hyacinthi]|uniref:Uncharacterized protein n=1 Tax=Botrytis hyacinthi TaxID=278943 RepID=A0A4Z1GHC8_9HELO|nr:hypothetical protein BHYA_0127g00240 [Botrytis hyacinthi]